MWPYMVNLKLIDCFDIGRFDIGLGRLVIEDAHSPDRAMLVTGLQGSRARLCYQMIGLGGSTANAQAAAAAVSLAAACVSQCARVV
jgi:hypothetical protein